MKIALITAFPPSRHALNEYGFHVAEQLRQERCVDLTVLGDYLPTPADELPGFKVIAAGVLESLTASRRWCAPSGK
jgi:hypothetical protein